MNILELYERGHTKFKFSDGKTREVDKFDRRRPKDSLRFDIQEGRGTGPRIWYWNDTGVPNIRPHDFPHVTGVEGMNKRDEIQQAIEQGVSNAAAPIGDDDYNEIVARILHELDSLVERWTDEETAEDLDKSIRKSEVYEGMRVRMIDPDDSDVPVGHTGTIVHPDKDGIPAVMWDNAEYNTCTRPHNHGKLCNHATLEELEKV